MRVVSECASRYNFDGDEAIRMLGLSEIRVVNSSEVVNKRSVKRVKTIVAKPAFALPYNGECAADCCSALRQNNGLYTQCQIVVDGAKFCKQCQISADKNDGIPEYGTIEQRQAVDMFEYIDPKGRKQVHYTKVMKKLKLTQEQVLEEAGKFNININIKHFEEEEKETIKRGRPKSEKAPKEPKGAKGRPKKGKKVIQIEGDDDDLFATLVADANNNSIEEVVVETVAPIVAGEKKSKGSSKDKEAEKQAKEAEKQAKALAKEAEKQEKEAKLEYEKEAKLEAEKKAKEAKKLEEAKAKEAEKQAKEAEKQAKLEAEKQAKEAKKLEEAKAKEAEKQAKEAEKQAKEAKKLEEAQAKLEKEAKLAADKLAKEAEKQAKEAEKQAKEAEKQAKLEAEKKAKEAEKSTKKPTKEAKKPAAAAADDDEPDVVKKIEFEGKKYLKSKKSGVIYDYVEYTKNGEQVVIGKWNDSKNKIEFNETSEESEDEYDM
jgi:hypothetical protein